MKKENCVGCRNQIYENCFQFSAKTKLVKKICISNHQVPPYKNRSAKKIPPCYHNNAYFYIEPEKIDKDGYVR